MKNAGPKQDFFTESMEESEMAPMLEVDRVTFSYRRGHPVYCDFSLDLYPGQVYALLGENGVGKTTLMKLMTSLLFPEEGEVRFHGKKVARRLPSMLSDLFFIPEEVELPSMRKEKFVASHAPFYPRFDRELFEEWLLRFRVFPDKKVDRLSMGERKKFYLSFAAATRCSLLLLDEPTNGLDIPGKDEFRRLVASFMSEQRMVLISTHQVREIQQMLDRLLILDLGRVSFNASFAEIAECFRFEVLPESELPSGMIYTEPVPGGMKVLYPNNTGYAEDEVDVELLFKAVIQSPVRVRAALEQSLKKNRYE